MLLTAEPWEASSFGNAFKAAVLSGIVMNANPTRNKMVRITIYVTDIVVVKSMTSTIEKAMSTVPMIKSGFAPKRSNNLPVTGDKNALIIAAGSKIKPAINGLKPSPSCKKSAAKLNPHT